MEDKNIIFSDLTTISNIKASPDLSILSILPTNDSTDCFVNTKKDSESYENNLKQLKPNNMNKNIQINNQKEDIIIKLKELFIEQMRIKNEQKKAYQNLSSIINNLMCKLKKSFLQSNNALQKKLVSLHSYINISKRNLKSSLTNETVSSSFMDELKNHDSKNLLNQELINQIISNMKSQNLDQHVKEQMYEWQTLKNNLFSFLNSKTSLENQLEQSLKYTTKNHSNEYTSRENEDATFIPSLKSLNQKSIKIPDNSSLQNLNLANKSYLISSSGENNSIPKDGSCSNQMRISDFLQNQFDKMKKDRLNHHYIPQIIKKTFIFRNRNKLLSLHLKKIIKKVQDLKNHLPLSNIFGYNYFRSKGKVISYTRRLLNSPYLFNYVGGAPMIMCLENLLRRNQIRLPLYNQTSDIDATFYKDIIYIGGGYFKGQVSSEFHSISLSNLKGCPHKILPNLKQPRCYFSLVSSPYGIFILGGYNGTNLTRSCEKFDENSGWKNIPDLNIASGYLTSSYCYPMSIYTFGGNKTSIIEKIDLKGAYKWMKINIYFPIFRKYGFCIQNSENEIMLFGGSDTLTEMQIFDLRGKLRKSSLRFNNYFYQGSKPKIIGNTVYINSSYPSRKRILIHLNILSVEEKAFS